MVLSEPIFLEVARTFTQATYFKSHLSQEQRAANLSLLIEAAILQPITADVSGVATHPEDDLILATAVSGEVDYLVTGDRKLQGLHAYEGVRIVSPREFLNVLSTQKEDLS